MLALHTLPTSWATVTLTQAAQLHALGDAPIQDALAVLLGCSAPELLTLTPNELGAALHLVLFLAEPQPDLYSFPRPTTIFIGEVEVPVFDSLDDISFGQAADIGAAIQELAQDVPALRIRLLATLLQPAYDGTPYDSDRATVLEKLCGNLTLAEALPLTDFFLPTSTASAVPTPPT